ncbi:MAG: hypothetical protein K2N52_02225 [Clostridia bacterium]|nr:hypothetical protein [Clostridia bacterium]
MGIVDNLENREVLGRYAATIRKDLEEHKTNFFYLGVHLIDLYRSEAYALTFDRDSLSAVCKLPIGAGPSCSQCFFEYCYNEFGLDKTQVSRYMNIVDEFGDALRGYQERWKNYSYSQLCELLPLTSEQRKPVESSWTIRQIRDYKKNLVMSQSDDASDTSEEPPETKYSRFDKWTRIELCDKIFDLEEEYAELLRLYEQLKACTSS